MEKGKLELLLDKLPYSDGGGRRRFVAGGMFLIGIAILNWSSFQGVLGTQIQVMDLLKSTVVLAGSVLIVYSLGMIIELFGEVFMIRAASGFLWAFNYPNRKISKSEKYSADNKAYKYIYFILYSMLVPLLAWYEFIRGFFGNSSYSITLKEPLLSTEAEKLIESFPDKVREGITMPVGKNSTLAFKYLPDQLVNSQDSLWAKKLISRTKEISTVTTTLVVLAVIWIVSTNLNDNNSKLTEDMIAMNSMLDDVNRHFSYSSLVKTLNSYSKKLNDAETTEDKSKARIEYLALMDELISADLAVSTTPTSRTSDISRDVSSINKIVGWGRDIDGSRSDYLRAELIQLRSDVANDKKIFIDKYPIDTILRDGEIIPTWGLGYLDYSVIRSSNLVKFWEKKRSLVEKASIKMESNQVLSSLIIGKETPKKFGENIKQLNEFKKQKRQDEISKARFKLLLPISTVPLLFLYVGFFVSLKQTIITILEAIAIDKRQRR